MLSTTDTYWLKKNISVVGTQVYKHPAAAWPTAAYPIRTHNIDKSPWPIAFDCPTYVLKLCSSPVTEQDH